MESIAVKNISYLQARDPSILAWNRTGLNQIRVNLAEEFFDNSTASSNAQEPEKHGIEVFLRIKDGVPYQRLYEINENQLTCSVPEGSNALRNVREGDTMTRTYSFTRILTPGITQVEIFNDIVKSKVLGFINGKNCSLLTYGASGSGKTFTLVGTSEDPGILPRALEYIFRSITVPEVPKLIPLQNGEVKVLDKETHKSERTQKYKILGNTYIEHSTHIKTYKQMQQKLSCEAVAEVDNITDVSLSIWVSFAEIYNENVYDLLIPTPRGQRRCNLRLVNSNGTCFIKDLTTVSVSSGLEAYRILQYGLHNLNYAATSVNSHSSRSHCIFTIKLVQNSEVDGGVCVSTFNFCDLAGSERVKKTNNCGDRLKESNNINTSLLVLSRCISGIKMAQQQKDNRCVPFRESKLTQLFQRALTGLEDIMMVVSINPSLDMFDETLHVLNFSAIAQEILVEDHRKVKPKKVNRFSLYMEGKTADTDLILDQTAEISKLKLIISELLTKIQNNKEEYEVELELEREHLITKFKTLIENIKKRREEEMATALERMKQKYEKQIELLKEQIDEHNCDDSDVINISSSSTDEELAKDEFVNQENEYLLELEHVKRELINAKEETKRMGRELLELREQNVLLTEENSNLKMTLQDAKTEYNELQSECNDLQNRNKALMSETVQLRERINYYVENNINLDDS